MKKLINFNNFVCESLTNNQLNRLLDKISEFGYESLSQHDKTLLNSYSDKSIDIKAEIEKHQNKFKTAKEIIDVVPLKVEGNPLEQNIGRFLKFKVKKGNEKAMGLYVILGMIYEIVAIQKHWGYNENGRYVPDRIGYRVAEVGKDDDFGRVCSVDEAEFLNISEEEAIKLNKEVHEIINKKLGEIEDDLIQDDEWQ
jgi:hypothetical protein